MASRKCAKFFKDYIMSSDLEISSSDDSEYEPDKDLLPLKLKEFPVEEKKVGGIERRPTRQPDPNVSNRNALLARENRRKKKEQLVNLEKEVEKLRSENGVMKKMMKKQDKLYKSLQNKNLHYAKLLNTQQQTISLMESFNYNMKRNSYADQALTPSTSVGSNSPLSVTDINDAAGTLTNLDDLSSFFVPDFIDSLFLDSSSLDYKSYDPTNYDDLLGENSPFHVTSGYLTSTDCISIGGSSSTHSSRSSTTSFPAEPNIEVFDVCLHSKNENKVPCPDCQGMD